MGQGQGGGERGGRGLQHIRTQRVATHSHAPVVSALVLLGEARAMRARGRISRNEVPVRNNLKNKLLMRIPLHVYAVYTMLSVAVYTMLSVAVYMMLSVAVSESLALSTLQTK